MLLLMVIILTKFYYLLMTTNNKILIHLPLTLGKRSYLSLSLADIVKSYISLVCTSTFPRLRRHICWFTFEEFSLEIGILEGSHEKILEFSSFFSFLLENI